MRFILVLVLVFIGACGNIEQSKTLSNRAVLNNKNLVAGLGDTILEIKKEESMPNVFGKADLYGRKRPTGVTYVVYAGVYEGKAYFYRRDVVINSQKTTMNSSPIFIPNTSTSTVSGYANGQPVSGTVTTSGPPTILPALPPSDQVASSRDTILMVEPNSSNDTLLVDGYMIKVKSANDNVLSYEVRAIER